MTSSTWYIPGVEGSVQRTVSPEPASNWTASLGEDAVVLAGLSLAFAHPWLSLSLVLGLGMVVFGTLFWLARRLSAGLRRRT